MSYFQSGAAQIFVTTHQPYFVDALKPAALLSAYPAAKKVLLESYIPDAVRGTWERLADIVHPGGSKAIQKAGWPIAGNVKHEWANKIGPLMDPDRNRSPSFGKLRDGLRRLAQG